MNAAAGIGSEVGQVDFVPQATELQSSDNKQKVVAVVPAPLKARVQSPVVAFNVDDTAEAGKLH